MTLVLAALLHTPVLLQEVLHWMRPVPGEVMVDATFGAGGHGLPLLERLRPGGRIIGIDRDREILDSVRERQAQIEGLTLIHANFRDLDRVLDDEGLARVDGILFDLGASSFQLGKAERGFSFQAEGPLDMRMDRATTATRALDLVNTKSRRELEEILLSLGEEREASRIAAAIERARDQAPIETTTRLAELVRRAKRSRPSRIDPATKVFQALRIAVNEEIRSLEEALPQALRRLAPGGRLAVISFHSLEDRVVKSLFRERSSGGGRGRGAWELPFKKPLLASDEEVRSNPRSRSARLRVIVRERLQ